MIAWGQRAGPSPARQGWRIPRLPSSAGQKVKKKLEIDPAAR